MGQAWGGLTGSGMGQAWVRHGSAMDEEFVNHPNGCSQQVSSTVRVKDSTTT